METIIINLAFLILYIITGFFIYRNLNKNKKSEYADQSKDTNFEALGQLDFDLDSLTQSCPYGIHIKNSTNEDLTCVLFGCDEFLLSENFGSHNALQIKPDHSVSYLKLLLQSAFKPFEVGLIRMYCSNELQFKENINTNSADANGQACFIPVHTEAYIPPIEQQEDWNRNIIEIPYSTIVDCSVYWKIKVLANTEFTLHIYPKKKINSTNLLNEKQILKKYAESKPISPKIVKN